MKKLPQIIEDYISVNYLSLVQNLEHGHWEVSAWVTIEKFLIGGILPALTRLLDKHGYFIIEVTITEVPDKIGTHNLLLTFREHIPA
jgi:hypothetical protein